MLMKSGDERLWYYRKEEKLNGSEVLVDKGEI